MNVYPHFSLFRPFSIFVCMCKIYIPLKTLFTDVLLNGLRYSIKAINLRLLNHVWLRGIRIMVGVHVHWMTLGEN